MSRARFEFFIETPRQVIGSGYPKRVRAILIQLPTIATRKGRWRCASLAASTLARSSPLWHRGGRIPNALDFEIAGWRETAFGAPDAWACVSHRDVRDARHRRSGDVGAWRRRSAGARRPRR